MTHRLALALALTLLTGCTQYLAPDLAPVSVATWPIIDGSPAAVGLLDLLNDPTTTVDVLDDDVPLDARAASNLIAARDADGDFTSVADVDAVYWVGSSAIAKMVTFAASQGRVPGPNDALGTWDGVEFTVAQTELTLEIVVNDLEHYDFDVYIGLDRRAADSIVAAQPVATVHELAGLYYVGTSALETLNAATADMMGDEWSDVSCVPTFTLTSDPSADDLSELLALSTTVDAPAYEVLSVETTGCPGEWWTTEAGNATLWDFAFFISMNELPSDYAEITPWQANGGYTGALNTALTVIDERINDGDWDPASSQRGQTLDDDRLNLVDDLSGELQSNPTPFLQKNMYLDMSECSEEADLLLDTRDGSILIAHAFSRC